MSVGVSDPQVIGTIVLSSTALMSLIIARIGKSSVRARSGSSGVRFTDDIHASLVVAMREALTLRCSSVDTEHLLLGVLATNAGRASTILSRLGVNPARVYDTLLAGMRPGHAFTTSDLPYSHRAFRVLDETALEALALGHTIAGTEHLILGILRHGKGPAARVLFEAGVTLEAMRRETARYPD
jgi:ATP-dependent Clp protease ATP-binding subunit ClpC